MSDDEIKQAYAEVGSHQRAVLADMETLAEDFATRFNALKDRLPAEAASTTVAQYLSRVQGAVTNVFGYDLANTKIACGMVPVTPTSTPAAQSS